MSDALDRLASALADRYRIERELGQGGMATVYLAHDLKHDRKVALKVLKPELAAVLGAERFVQEIRTTASLQHPHILPLFDSGTADGFLYYVMPFIEGETLRDKLNRETQLGVDEAIRVAREVADALDYAHRRGVIHRDIKPENILLHDGRPVVADFGIALAVSAAAGGRMTETGLSLGTPHYMSPEQATADKEISGRSDVYSLASVLYEMLAGQPPHLGGSAQQIIMKIIAEPVDPVTRYRKSVPPHVAAAIGKALEKLPADRFGSAREFSEALQNPSFSTTRTDTVVTAFAAATARKSRGVAAMAVAIALLATMIGAWGWLRPLPAPVTPVLRYVDGLLTDSLLESPRRDFALSADGARMAFVAGMIPNQGHILVRDRNQLTTALIPGSQRAAAPFFSPDGRRVAFFTGTGPGVFNLKTAPLDGGPSHTLAERLNPFTGTWEADSFIYVQQVGATAISRVREGGGGITRFTTLDSARGETLHRTPKSMHDGRRILFIAVTNDSGPQVAIADLSSGRHRHIGLRAVAAWYATTGHILLVSESGVLQVVPFDASRELVSGDPEIVAEGFNGNAGLDVALSASGTLIYLPSGEATRPDEILWLNRDGTVIPSPVWTADFADMALSPDGKQLAVGIRERGIVEMWVRNVESGTNSRLTFAVDGSTSEPAWTIDGSAVTFLQSERSSSSIRQRRADGSTPASPVTPMNGNFEDVTWAPDGRLFVEVALPDNRDIFSVRPGKDTVLTPVLTSRFNETDAVVSPDGRWLVYASNESGRSEVYVRPLADLSAVRSQVSVDGGNQPQRSPSGRELYFTQIVRNENTPGRSFAIVVVDVRPGPAFATSVPRVLFTRPDIINYWGMTPDGKRFVIVTPVSQRGTQRPQVIVVDRWTSELRKASR